MIGRFLGSVTGKIHDRDPVSDFSQMGRRPIQLDYSFTRLAENDIGFEPRSIVQIANENFLIFPQVDERGQIGGNGEAAFVVQARASNGGAIFDFSSVKCTELSWARLPSV